MGKCFHKTQPTSLQEKIMTNQTVSLTNSEWLRSDVSFQEVKSLLCFNRHTSLIIRSNNACPSDMNAAIKSILASIIAQNSCINFTEFPIQGHLKGHDRHVYTFKYSFFRRLNRVP